LNDLQIGGSPGLWRDPGPPSHESYPWATVETVKARTTAGLHATKGKEGSCVLCREERELTPTRHVVGGTVDDLRVVQQ
jgi:hypothetical protein